MADCTRGIRSLPNEILIDIFSFFPTRFLLTLSPTSHHFHNIILRIIHCRLFAVSKATSHKIVLESYLPSAKYTTPYFFCDLLSTDDIPENELCKIGALGKLWGMYSHYKPAQPEWNRKVWRMTTTGLVVPSTFEELGETKEEFVAQNIELESHEFFSQLQSVTSLVKSGRKISIHEGLTRVWRDWLLECSESPASLEAEDGTKKRLLWSSTHQHTGFQFGVNRRHDVVPGLRLNPREENLNYTLRYQELVIRTSQILFAFEHALEQEFKHVGKSLVLIG